MLACLRACVPGCVLAYLRAFVRGLAQGWRAASSLGLAAVVVLLWPPGAGPWLGSALQAELGWQAGRWLWALAVTPPSDSRGMLAWGWQGLGRGT
eukprot:13619164-Alexandrium_andersonii.AAC.1